ncbi:MULTISPECIES: sodium:solute symporter family protein [Desulfovibrio]|uniref:Solute:Na+ symporter, SSS family n=1 Tax=Desulfovibrio desulfuricans TaxID=876 RepID=A0AA94HUE3_DESDE|nr:MULTISPECIES: sodium:solute symporter family protein [Desulfovibrio]SFW65584.1 solute:Na+ symporter, SSS family [Desulfovibrio desulfuricans]SPD37097.1 Sodium/solute symporter [Desulfovibrio sp. G11]
MIFLLIYIAVLFLLAWITARRAPDKETYFVNGRRSSANVVALSIVASCVGGSATMGMAGLAWQVGTPAIWWLLSGAAGLVLLSLFLARKVRRSGAITMPEMLTTFLGAPSRPLASVIIVTAWLAILAAQFSALATIIAPLAGIDKNVAMLVGAAVLVGHTLAGGQASVMKTDIWQFGILLLSLLTALLLTLHLGGGEAITAVQVEVLNEQFPASKLRYFLCILGGSYVVCPMLFGRMLSARDEHAARKGGLMAAVGLTFTAALIVILGISCRDLVPAGTPPEQVLTTALLSHLPAWAATLILLGIFSAIFSAADSCLITAASVCSNDILRKPGVKICRICLIFLGLMGLVLALPGRGILALLLMANDIYVCGVVPPVFIGMLLHGKVQFRPWGMAVAILGGGLMGLTAALTGNSDWSFAGLAFSLFMSLVAARRSPQSVEKEAEVQAGHGI